MFYIITCEDLKTINRIPNESEISLKLYAEFFEKYLANRLYNIFLENNIKLVMQIAQGNYPHLIALHKFKADPQFIGNNLLKNSAQLEKFTGFCNLKYEKIKINDLKLIKDKQGNFVYDMYRTRILASPFIYQILRNSSFLAFDVNKVMGNSTIKADYLFVNDIDKNKLHLFIKDNKGVNYPISFFNREHTLPTNQLNYFIDNQKVLKINKIEILDFKTKNLLETIIPGQTLHNLFKQEAAATKALSIKDSIIDLYNKEFPAIRYIKNSTATIIDNINKEHGHILTIKEIKALHCKIGKKIEANNNENDRLEFKPLKEIVEDFKNCNLTEKQIQAHEKSLNNKISKFMDIEL